jgi:OPA family sugar phosphate sensor protein UhpC-like MFS transporter
LDPKITPAQRAYRHRIFALTWLAYAGFYLCRKNFSVAMPSLKTDLGFTDESLAWVITGYHLLYMLGQFGNGLLSDRWGPRLIVGIGLVIAIVSNVAMGFAASLAAFAVLNCVNGYGQATGWPGLIKNMAAWYRHHERGVVMAWWGTCYVLGAFVATRFAAWCIADEAPFPALGWQRAFWGPALVLAVIALLFILFARNTPTDAGLPEIDVEAETTGLDPVAEPRQEEEKTTSVIREVLSQSAVWITGASYFFVKLTRYALAFWLPVYMVDHLGYSKVDAGNTSAYYELAGFFGAVTAGYLSDKLFRSRRFPVGALMLFGLAAAFLLHVKLARSGITANVIGLSLIGFMTFGPDTLMTGAGAMDLGTRRGAATAAGVINGMGSCGQLLSSLVVAYFAKKFGWDSLFYLFAAFSLVAALLLTTKWNFGGRKAQAAAG